MRNVAGLEVPLEHPGNQITPRQTPQLAAAVRKSLESRLKFRKMIPWSQALSCPQPAAASSMTPPPAPEKCAPRQLWIAQRPRATAYRLAAALETHGVAGCPRASERRPEEREAAAQGVGGAGYFEVITSEMPEAHEHVRVKSCADFFIDSVEVGPEIL